MDPVTEILTDDSRVSVPIGSAGDGTQIWKITHNGVDTHPIHFHLFNVQVINRVGWDGAIRPPDANELGWKETVRMNPLEDIIVALRPVAPKRALRRARQHPPARPDDAAGLARWASGTSTRNREPRSPSRTSMTNFGWEYVWHCHILSHEEMDMMRPMQFHVARSLPAAPVLSCRARRRRARSSTGPTALPATRSVDVG